MDVNTFKKVAGMARAAGANYASVTHQDAINLPGGGEVATLRAMITFDDGQFTVSAMAPDEAQLLAQVQERLAVSLEKMHVAGATANEITAMWARIQAANVGAGGDGIPGETIIHAQE